LHQWSQQQGHGRATERLAARFGEAFPAIQVEPVIAANYYEKLPAVLAGGDYPDVATTNTTYLMTLVTRGVVVPAETLSRGASRFDRNDMVASSREMVSFDGRVTAMPYILSNYGIAFNRTLFKQSGADPGRPPATWNDLVETGRRLSGGSEDAETWGFRRPRGVKQTTVDNWLHFLWQNGGEAVDVNRRRATFNSPAGAEALQFWVDLIHRHRVASLSPPAQVELKGRVGVWIIPIGSLSIVKGTVGDQFEWSATVLPKGKQAESNVGGHALTVLKTNRTHEAAWRFVQWFTAPPNVVEFNVPSWTLPPWRSAQQQPVWQRFEREEPRIRPVVEMLAYGHPPPKLWSWPDAQQPLGEAIEAALTQQRQPKPALDDAACAADAILKSG
jgi:multiple sugar transport system substrate-binding protein